MSPNKPRSTSTPFRGRSGTALESKSPILSSSLPSPSSPSPLSLTTSPRITVPDEDDLLSPLDPSKPRLTWQLTPPSSPQNKTSNPKIGRAVQQECRDRSRMPSSA
eukprot:TRINITY_DN37913_c0_g1_i2.p1 TRINITY_DN37913_c0_g1~~TRINITY_DN37913_c0_g1_i2.p1  ORF type:complete len:106 (-),score=19.22 TRINITY_DN37913_c0_g1_i2:11-328(-)